MTPKITVRAVALALDASGIHPAALELACELASRHGGELRSLLIEDIELLRAVALPFAREISWHSGEERAIDGDMLAARLQAQAEQLQEQLAQRAAPTGLRYSLRTDRAAFADAALAALRDADLVVLGRPTRSRWARGQLPHAPVVVLYTPESDISAMEDVAALLGASHPRRVSWTDAACTLATVKALHPGVVVAPASLTGADKRKLGALLDALDCPLVLVRDGPWPRPPGTP